MYTLYSIIMFLLIPFVILRLWWKGRFEPWYRERISERFCLATVKPCKVDIWVHAVSLGELIAATPLVDSFLKKGFTVLITTMTPSGSQRVNSYFNDKVLHQYIPYELPWVINRFFKLYTPKLGLIMETELWPNLLKGAEKFNIPLFLINGRLSQKSFKGYLAIKPLIKRVLGQFTTLLVQTSEDKQRFVKLGAKENNLPKDYIKHISKIKTSK